MCLSGKGSTGNRGLGRAYDALVRKLWQECASRGIASGGPPLSHLACSSVCCTGDADFVIDDVCLTLDAELMTQALFELTNKQGSIDNSKKQSKGGHKGSHQHAGIFFCSECASCICPLLSLCRKRRREWLQIVAEAMEQICT